MRSGYAKANLTKGLIALGAGIVLIGPASAQGKPVPPTGSVDLIADPIETCGFAVEQFEVAGDLLADAGWTLDDGFITGPYLDEVSATKDYEVGAAYYYAAVEYYPNATIGYCEYEIEAPTVPIDLNAFTNDYGLNGEVTTEGDGAFGAWELIDDGQTYHVLAYVTPELFHFQVTWVTAENPSSAGPTPK